MRDVKASGPYGIRLHVPRGSQEEAGPRGPTLWLAHMGTYCHYASLPRMLVLSQVTHTRDPHLRWCPELGVMAVV